jgi:ABC-type dipeptide/oligopeptide/nickel transport system permease subunit
MTAVAEPLPALGARARRRRLLWARFLRRKLAVACLIVIVVFVLAGAFAPLVAPYGYSAVDFQALRAPPSWHHLFGTDELGRDVFSRVLWGARASMQVGLLATALGMLVAVPLGLVAGYYGGWLDAAIARATDVMLAFPFVILAVLLASIIGPGLTTATLALGIAAVPRMLRISRGETKSLREAEFVPAAVASGSGDASIMFRHILPNMAAPLIVAATLTIPNAIIGEAVLSFLGLGIRVPTASWGIMLKDAQSFYYQDPLLAVFPGAAIVLIALAFNLLGDALRDILDPKLVR